MKIILYHGTSFDNAQRIIDEGFKDRVEAGVSNWEERVLSKAGFVYLTTAYPFFFGANAAKEDDEKATVFKVEVDMEDTYPDEDLIFFKFRSMFKVHNLEEIKHLAQDSLNAFGCVAVKPENVTILGWKHFDIAEMSRYSDPTISPINYRIMGKYYQDLTNSFFEGKELPRFEEIIMKNFK